MGGLNIALQDELDANEKMFVGGQHLRDLAGTMRSGGRRGEADVSFVGGAMGKHLSISGGLMKSRMQI